MIDKIQAVRFGGEHVFSGSRFTPKQQKRKFQDCFNLVTRPAVLLAKLLDMDAASELEAFVIGEFEKLSSTGYSLDVSNQYLGLTRDVFSNSSQIDTLS